MQGAAGVITGHEFTRENKPYADFGHFGLLYRIQSTSRSLYPSIPFFCHFLRL